MKIPFPLKTAIIDDNRTILKLMDVILEDENELDIEYFLDPNEALEAIKSNQFHLVITDINMPELCGDMLVRKIMDLRLGIDIIVMTGGINLIDAYACFKAGAKEIVFKPIDKIKLICSINESIEKFKKWNNVLDHIIKQKNI